MRNNKAKRQTSFLLRPVYAALIGFSLYLLAAPAQSGEPVPRNDHLHQSLRLNADWLIRGQRADGLFTYEVLPNEEGNPDKNNIVRQIGTFWSLIRVLEVDGRPEVRQAVSRFRQAIWRYIRRDQSPDGEIAHIEFGGLSKINSAALYLLSLASMKQMGMTLTRQELDIIPLLVKGIRQMADGKGGFWYIYYLDEDHNLITPYGSAEVIYALAMLADVTGDERLRDYARKTFMAYYDHYLRDLGEFQNTLFRAWFSWALHAQPLLGDVDEEARYKNYIRPMLALALAYRAANPVCADKGCIMALTAGDATFLEGFVAAHPIAKRHEQDESFVKAIESYIEGALQALLSLQVTADRTELFEKSPHGPDALIGGICFDLGCSFMRNDLNQHVMIAMLNYIQMVCLSGECNGSCSGGEGCANE